MSVDAVIVLSALFLPVLAAVWLITRRRRTPPPISEADAEIFRMDLEFCDDIAAAAKEGR